MQNKAERVVLAHWVKTDVLGTAWAAVSDLPQQRWGQRLPKRLSATLLSSEDEGCLESVTVPCVSQSNPRDCSNLCRPEIPFTVVLKLVLFSFY